MRLWTIIIKGETPHVAGVVRCNRWMITSGESGRTYLACYCDGELVLTLDADRFTIQ